MEEANDSSESSNLLVNTPSLSWQEKAKNFLRDVFVPKVNLKQLWWLIKLSLPEIPLILLGSVGLVITSGSNLVLPKFIGDVIDFVVNSPEGKRNLTKVLLILLGIQLLSSFFAFVRAFCFHLAAERVVARLRKRLFNNIVEQDISFFDTSKTGDLINRLSSDTTTLENAVTVNISMGLRHLCQAVGGTIILFVISWKLCLVMLSVLPPIMLFAAVYGRFVKKYSKRSQDALAASSAVAEEALGNIRTVRSFANETKMEKLFGEAVTKSYKVARTLAFLRGTFMGTMGGIGNLAVILVLWYGGTLVLNKEMSIGTLTSFLLYTLFVAVSIGLLSTLYFDYTKALGATRVIYELLHRTPDILSTSDGTAITIPSGMNGVIKFSYVDFSYPTRLDNEVLKEVNLELKPGKIVALIGESGGGKSTICSLIQRFYDPVNGSITVDGYDLKDLDPVWLRKNIGVVSQEPTLFAQSIRENITFGRDDEVEEYEMMEAAKKAYCDKFVKEFPKGYDTLVGERGVRLSGGQKQRVAIARAILKNPKILLLDEATSALDADSEYYVQKALDELMKDRSVLIIAHRLSTVKNAHEVCVVHDGKILEKGSHEELMKTGKQYKKLISRQLISSSSESKSQIIEI